MRHGTERTGESTRSAFVKAVYDTTLKIEKGRTYISVKCINCKDEKIAETNNFGQNIEYEKTHIGKRITNKEGVALYAELKIGRLYKACLTLIMIMKRTRLGGSSVGTVTSGSDILKIKLSYLGKLLNI